MELRLLHGSRTVSAGSSSDYTPQKDFFDKRYYVGSKEMETIDDFRRALEPYAPGGTVTVLTIDGVKPNKHLQHGREPYDAPHIPAEATLISGKNACHRDPRWVK